MIVQIGPPDGRIPAIIDLPASDTPLPAVLLIHGLGSTKEQMTGSIGRALTRRGVATLAIDLPLHGARAAGIDMRSQMSPLAVAEQWRVAVREASHCVRFLETRPEVDATRIGIAGYSLGASVALVVAANDPAVRAICLAAGGDVPADLPFAGFVRTIVDLRRSVRDIAGRPLLMVNGRFDRRIRPEAAEALFAAASEPKELRWYEGGHWPPTSVIDDASDWLSRQLAALPTVASHRSRTTVPRRA
jgi:dienelactone hydrolase